MKPVTNVTILMALVAGAALATASAVYAEDYAPQPRYEEPAPPPEHGAAITLGWHGDRYWDGHRYWEHDEWMHRHPHDPGPQHEQAERSY
ncbi:hypothetical protein [Paraburkholderia pallida]|uniref:Lipoprotein n=1 Tax=Paraburkholderia pallida TaxID=2547399 RepID=A0A4P7CXR8_9BURK|nr:hypothetical protein [Paraburkholderia pallida]QBQ99099.1 hypothetical protein E1956_17905 [Paraburkholderia pallida]